MRDISQTDKLLIIKEESAWRPLLRLACGWVLPASLWGWMSLLGGGDEVGTLGKEKKIRK